MDPDVIRTLRKAGVDTTLEKRFPSIPLRAGSDGDVLASSDEVCVVDGEAVVQFTPKRTSELFVGDRRPPDFSAGPTDEYMSFFVLIERTAADHCSCTGQKIRDKEFEQIYGDLRRRPDGRSDNPLFHQVRAALRLYMSLRDVSEAEYQAVLRRLERSARSFAVGPTSMNYVERALTLLLSPAGRRTDSRAGISDA